MKSNYTVMINGLIYAFGLFVDLLMELSQQVSNIFPITALYYNMRNVISL